MTTKATNPKREGAGGLMYASPSSTN